MLNKTPSTRKDRQRRGFTVLEIMIVFVIMGFLGAALSVQLQSEATSSTYGHEVIVFNQIVPAAAAAMSQNFILKESDENPTAESSQSPNAEASEDSTYFTCDDYKTAVQTQALDDDPLFSQCSGDATITGTFGGTGTIQSSSWAVRQVSDGHATPTVTLVVVHVSSNRTYLRWFKTTYSDSTLSTVTSTSHGGWSGSCGAGQSPTTTQAVASTDGNPCS
jgi:type II secretory pathway pseudopilin PulG